MDLILAKQWSFLRYSFCVFVFPIAPTFFISDGSDPKMPRSCKLLAGEPSVNLIGCPSAGNHVKKSCLSELAEHKPEIQTDAGCLYRFLGSCIDVAGQSNLMACDLTEVFKRASLWTSELPRVSPFYAVKCNTDLPLLKVCLQKQFFNRIHICDS